MKIGQRGLGEHIQLLGPLFGLIAAVWALRLILAIAHAPHFVIHYCSVTAAGSISILLAVMLIYFKKFGGYANVAASAVLLHLWAQLLISSAIAFGIVTGTTNIYGAPEFTFHMTPVQNLVSHLTVSLAFGSLVGTAMGCLLLWMLRKLVPTENIEKKDR